MKEVSLLLGDIVEIAPLIMKESDIAGLITVEQVKCTANKEPVESYNLVSGLHSPF